MAEKIVKVFFVFLLALFPLGELGRLQLVNDVAVHLNDILLIFVLGAWIIFSKTKIKQITKSKLFKPLLLFSVIALLSLIVKSYMYKPAEIIVAFLYLVRWLGYAMLFFVVGGFDVGFKEVIKYFMVVVGGIIVGLGYLQYFFYPNLRNLYYAGWDEHLYRMFSTFLDPNFAGAFFVMYLLFLLGLFWVAYKEKKYGSVQLYGGLLVLTFCAILLTFSRSAFLMLIVSMTVFLIHIKKTKFLFGFAIISFIFLGLVSRSLQSEGTNLFRTASNQARVESAQNAITIFLDNPVFGVGFNAYRYAQEKKGFLIETTKENHAGAGTDNSFLFVLATTGIVGFGAYLYFWYVILKKIHMNEVIFATVIGLLVNAMFINSLFYPPIMAFLWIELGLIMDYKQQ